MALPALIANVFLWLPLRESVAGALGGVLVTLALAALAVKALAFSPDLTVIVARHVIPGVAVSH
jgi:hypothetical protein